MIIVFLVIFMFFYNPISRDTFSGEMAQPIYKNKYRPSRDQTLIDDVVSWDGSVVTSNIIKEKLNPNFVDIQFHNDYRDVITAINNLVPEKRQRFNLANNVLQYSEPRSEEVSLMVKDFIKVLNNNLLTAVPESRNSSSGWDEAIPDPNVESGWSRVQKSLGLADSLYNEPAKKALVKLVAINYVQKYETDDEIKYSINLVIQKVNVEDQMIIKVSFVQDKRPLHDENNFFLNKEIQMKLVIEDVYFTGYLSNDGPDGRQQFDMDKEKYYEYDNMEYNNMTDPKYIQKVLMDKYQQRTLEMNMNNAMLDTEGQAFHKTLPHVYDFSNIQGTRTIYDDMNTKNVFY